MARIRNIPRQFEPTHATQYTNLLVSGCSFTYNNSETVACTWPYYLRDLANFATVYDASQSGAGTNHIFNSTIWELESNAELNSANTLVVIMLSGLTRTDAIADTALTRDYHSMSNYAFTAEYSTLSIYATDQTDAVSRMSRQYKTTVDPTAQILESLIKIRAVTAYLDANGYSYVLTPYQDPAVELSRLTDCDNIIASVNNSVDNCEYIYEYSQKNNQIDTDGAHPSPDAHLAWTRNHLIPVLERKQYITKIT